MFDEPIEIRSAIRSPVARCAAGSSPAERILGAASTVVVAGVADRSGESFCGCCPVVNFFTSADTARRWLDQHPMYAATLSRLATRSPPPSRLWRRLRKRVTECHSES